jgi:hypothetical protein
VADPPGEDNEPDGARSGDVAPGDGHPGGIWRVTRHLDFLGDQLRAIRLVLRGLRAVTRRQPPV